MSAQIVDIATARTRRAEARYRQGIATPARFQFWSGASGRFYVHTIHSLLGCPEVPAANFVLVRRETSGRRIALRIGRVEHEAPCLNLATLRQLGAMLGANEIHVHLIATSAAERAMIELDIAAADAGATAQRSAVQ